MLKSQTTGTLSPPDAMPVRDTRSPAEESAAGRQADEQAIHESPKRRAHRQRMKAFLAATRPAT
jgi:hypothetical protein